MPVYKGVIRKRIILSPDVQWTNTYWINSSNPVTALADLEQVAQLEQAVMGETAEVYRIGIPGPGGGIVGPYEDMNLVGLQTVADPDTLLPLWNVARVTLISVGSRPEIKYLKLPLYTDMVNGQQLALAVVTSLTTDYATPLLGLGFVCGPNGEPHTSFDVQNLIQMRQTGWHRRSRPGFVRGWVPV